ncbi:outer membrane lipoprotein chaperone LolA [Pseudoxanthomonas wuyuanensis]|uniref:Outer-membrane lipoprotein carrier protein n=1 Tax=Pseudoxanthomonas wuyuanensis TaxID=1073196 RepID=A0A286CYG7_9GAMM|nr:outer membrane lipoprotein chaperone LolA [Pseudoxanthomonas wuyuanensis]KAF1722738.1 outer membrane lipoprotein chaperone LolA [Pseudoxanthomonas wuyuanensis]SOD51437.1 outer membrane lipoprotein carrier protein [Pseudoxanthomonas wuyuanensis]
MIRIARYAVLATALFAGTAFAGARDQLKSFTTGLKGLDGQFTQQVFDGGGKLKESSSGRVALSAPRLFRWEYVKPYEQLIVADGSKVWVYDPDLQQVTVREQGVEEQNSPLSALIDPGKLDQQFNVSDGGSRDGLEWLALTPKNEGDASFQSARLGFDGNGLAQMEVVDAVGQRTAIRFSGWKRNPAFAATTFKYSPAAGVDVVGDL